MKIGIVTIIGEYNYGNLLQSYALQTILRRLGHTPIILNRRSKSPTIRLRIIRIISFVISVTLRYIFGKKERLIINPFLEDYSPKAYSEKSELKRFVKEYIERTEPLRNTKSMQTYTEQECFDVMVVGSDQVWREVYVPSIEEMFLSFLPNDSHVKRIAYAGSFGTDENYISKEKMHICKNLVKKFNAVSVREISAVNICKEQFGVSARHVLDPTMLLNVEDYKSLFNRAVVHGNEDNLLVYILDNNEDIKRTIESLAIKYNLNSYAVNAVEVKNQKSYKYKFPSVETWLRGFYDAKYVITDSFHGTVFSIIFNKPFICLGNDERGSSRFNSLLGMFDLENRLVNDVSKVEEVMAQSICWERVNAILNEKKNESIDFLQKNLV